MVICDLDKRMKHLLKVVLSMFIPAADVKKMNLSLLTQQKLETYTFIDDLNLPVGNDCRTLVVHLEENSSFNSTDFFR